MEKFRSGNGRGTSRRQASGMTKVRFIEDDAARIAELEIETNDRASVMLDLARLLFRLRIDILIAQSRTHGARRIERVRLSEHDGGAITDDRRAEIRARVLELVERRLEPGLTVATQ
jgi:UTP:GlnB (protein PII) uridylyltransferase